MDFIGQKQLNILNFIWFHLNYVFYVGCQCFPSLPFVLFTTLFFKAYNKFKLLLWFGLEIFCSFLYSFLAAKVLSIPRADKYFCSFIFLNLTFKTHLEFCLNVLVRQEPVYWAMRQLLSDSWANAVVECPVSLLKITELLCVLCI